jgi:MFS transporter, DHA2 family, multidrug resistance protein
MSYLGGSAPGAYEAWERDEGRFITETLAGLTHRRRLAILLSVGLVTAIEISNRISVNVLLPDMQGNVAADSDQISWVVTLYNLGFLCSLALAAWTTRVLGARRHLLLCIGFYSVGALGCTLSEHSLALLLTSRLIMGFGGGAFLVRAVTLAGQMFPGPARLPAVTLLYVVLYSFLITYPTAIGWIDDQFHWNYAFLLDFPFLAIGTVLIWKLIPSGRLFRRRVEGPVDVPGAILLIVSLACLTTALSRGERDLWFESSWVGPTLLVSAICFAAFLWRDSRPENSAPVFHLRIIAKQAPLRASFAVILIVGAMLGAALFALPQYTRFVQDYSATQTGGFISMYTAGLAVGALLSLRVLIPRIGGPWTVMLGFLLLVATYTTIVYTWTPTTPTKILAPILFLQGFSLGPVLIGASNIATSHSSLPDLADVSTSYFFVRQIGNTFGVNAATVLYDRRLTFHSSRILDQANRLNSILRTTLAQYANVVHRNGGGSNPSLGALQLFQGDVIVQSRLLSHIDIYFCLAALAGIGLILVAIARIERTSRSFHFHLW